MKGYKEILISFSLTLMSLGTYLQIVAKYKSSERPPIQAEAIPLQGNAEDGVAANNSEDHGSNSSRHCACYSAGSKTAGDNNQHPTGYGASCDEHTARNENHSSGNSTGNETTSYISANNDVSRCSTDYYAAGHITTCCKSSTGFQSGRYGNFQSRTAS